MNDAPQKTLLPSGVADLLPPEAQQLQLARSSLLNTFAGFGYELVGTPLLEFEDSILAGRGVELSTQTFRVMDPLSQRMMGFRPDITLQIARVAASRMQKAPRPLRLCYSGAVLRVKGDAFRNLRERWQAGIELIGNADARANIEAIRIAGEALTALGVKNISIDLNLPGLVQAVLAGEKESEALLAALERKNVSVIRDSASTMKPVLLALLEASGPAEQAVKKLEAIALPASCKPQIAELKAIVSGLLATAPDLTLTVDPVENRGFEYHTGISFSIFARGIAQELGRGGSYALFTEEKSEKATGFSLYLDTLLRHLPLPKEPPRILVPADASKETIAKLQAEGYATLFARGTDREAAQLRCTHIWKNGRCEKC